MNAGTALHEQNGVMTPVRQPSHCHTFATPSQQCARAFDRHERTQNGDREMMPTSRSPIFDHVIAEEVQGGTRSALGAQSETS